jgi:hypothetical protein
MNPKECNQRACECAANAAAAADESVSLEFLKLAAEWRAMAVREIFVGYVDGRDGLQYLGNPLALPES